MNSKLKHTPGPWNDSDGYGDIIHGPNSEHIADVRGFGAKLPMDANGRVIAAAPEMLECLIESCYFQHKIYVKDKNDKIGLRIFTDMLEKEIKIIEKATGLKIEELINEW